MKYSILIQWSEEDNAYIVSLPEWGKYARTHGSTYEEALQNAQEVLEDLIQSYHQDNKPLPSPQTLKLALEKI
ncbi:type II toxin-antitoxin system HicB family antitoxin [Roseofilum casamattae]|uniref:Type II toxin-antitoxin system HicB family antitoxin n=1 Tax=Roseofilum casamattae BLCC-M143 TaxID=3022442 RepID=A0ABT7C2U8_9CYAN|nr:type II toxin-antitoxin system HicB family antitoxin [Roseofilum casamattae]MDJ1185615.1 type II toxin-antitoxin system HicB family antitoxin [Roseofilum casamattae BLCC-M143]